MAGGDIPVPGTNKYMGARLLLGEDPSGNLRIVAVAADGKLRVDAELEVSDIQIGAVEIKDENSTLRADVEVDGANGALHVMSNSMATQATLAAVLAKLSPDPATQTTLASLLAKMTDDLQTVRITDGTTQAAVIVTLQSLKSDLSSVAGTATDVNSGDKSDGSQRIVIASDDVLTLAIKNALEIIDNCIKAIGDSFDGDPAIIGAVAEATVPTERADGVVGLPWYDTFMRQVIAGYDPSTGTILITDTAPAVSGVAHWDDWVALTAPAQETPVANVQDYHDLTVQYVIASIDTSVDLKIWGSIDGTNWFLMTPTVQVLAADDQTDAIFFSHVKVNYIKCEFDAEAGGVAATVTFALMAGN